MAFLFPSPIGVSSRSRSSPALSPVTAPITCQLAPPFPWPEKVPPHAKDRKLPPRTGAEVTYPIQHIQSQKINRLELYAPREVLLRDAVSHEVNDGSLQDAGYSKSNRKSALD